MLILIIQRLIINSFFNNHLESARDLSGSNPCSLQSGFIYIQLLVCDGGSLEHINFFRRICSVPVESSLLPIDAVRMSFGSTANKVDDCFHSIYPVPYHGLEYDSNK